MNLRLATLGLSTLALTLTLAPLSSHAEPTPSGPSSPSTPTAQAMAVASASVKAPNSPRHPALITVHNLHGRTVEVTGGIQGAENSFAFTLREDQTAPVPAHDPGWKVGATYEWTFTFSDGTVQTRTFRLANGEVQQKFEVAVNAPTNRTSPATVTITGLADGQWVNITGAPKGWTLEAPYFREVQQKGSGALKVRMDAPDAGWPLNQQYIWMVDLPDGTAATRSFTVTERANATAQPSKPQPSAKKSGSQGTPKTRTGGLAKTGV